jgi:hypothetical protein
MPILTVTVASLIAKGYPVSTLKSEPQVTLADSDIKEAYFPMTETFADAKTVTLLHALVYSLLLRRKIVATRYGSMEKNSSYSVQAEDEAITQEIRSYCASRLEKYILTIPLPSDKDYYYDDILRIYDIFLR